MGFTSGPVDPMYADSTTAYDHDQIARLATGRPRHFYISKRTVPTYRLTHPEAAAILCTLPRATTWSGGVRVDF